MTRSVCGLAVPSCARADAMVDVPGMHIIELHLDDDQRLVLTVESDSARWRFELTATGEYHPSHRRLAMPRCGCGRVPPVCSRSIMIMIRMHAMHRESPATRVARGQA